MPFLSSGISGKKRGCREPNASVRTGYTASALRSSSPQPNTCL